MLNTNKELTNYYDILEVSKDASQEDIHSAYLKAKNTYSPDSVALYSLFTEKECNEMLDLVETAYSVLSIPNKRLEYDRAHGIVNRFNRNLEAQGQSNGMAATGTNGPGHSRSFHAANAYGRDHRVASQTGPNTHENQPHQQDQFSNDFRFTNKNEATVSKLGAQSRFQLQYNKNPDFEQEIENTQQFNGQFLKKIREYKNVPLDRMADLIKVSRTYLQQIENEEFSKLPAPAYVRGFVYQFAKCLKLNPDLVANSYLNMMKEQKKK